MTQTSLCLLEQVDDRLDSKMGYRLWGNEQKGL
jgi:hypothetical protein